MVFCAFSQVYAYSSAFVVEMKKASGSARVKLGATEVIASVKVFTSRHQLLTLSFELKFYFHAAVLNYFFTTLDSDVLVDIELCFSICRLSLEGQIHLIPTKERFLSMLIAAQQLNPLLRYEKFIVLLNMSPSVCLLKDSF